MIERLRYRTIQSGLLLFWAIWTSLVLLTNVLDALRHAGVLPADFRLVSGNFTQVSATTAAQGIPAVLNIVLFAGVLLWEGTAARLLWGAWTDFRKHGSGTSPAVERAFVVSLALWAAFLIADEALVAYAVEGTHMRILVAQLVTLLVVRGGVTALPAGPQEKNGSGAGAG